MPTIPASWAALTSWGQLEGIESAGFTAASFPPIRSVLLGSPIKMAGTTYQQGQLDTSTIPDFLARTGGPLNWPLMLQAGAVFT